MKIIILVPEMPYPANTGGRIVLMKRIEYLSKHNDIHLFVVTDSEQDGDAVSELKRYCKTLHLYDRSRHKICNVIKSLWKNPYACSSRTFKQMRDDVYNCYKNVKPDVIDVEFPQMLGNLHKEILYSGKVVLGLHNIEWITMRNLGHSLNGLRKFVFYLEALRMKRFEERFYRKFPFLLYTFVSTEDKRFFEDTYHKTNTLLVPIGTEIKASVITTQSHNIMYFGKMSYPANIHAVKWFVQKVLPLILRKIPNCRFYIVGKDPAPSLIQMAEQNGHIIVTGTVDSVETYYDKADIVVIPLFFGGGVKVKLLEALGHQKLVISISKGIEGTDFTNGIHLITADDEQNFARLCIDALCAPDKYTKVVHQGHQRVKDFYSWDSVVDKFEKELYKLQDN